VAVPRGILEEVAWIWDGACCVVVVMVDILGGGVERKEFDLRGGSRESSILETVSIAGYM